MQRYENGTLYRTTLNGEIAVESGHSTNMFTFRPCHGPSENTKNFFLYASNRNVADWRTNTLGCMEEPTYQISDYASVDLTRALDLDIDHVPTVPPGPSGGRGGRTSSMRGRLPVAVGDPLHLTTCAPARLSRARVTGGCPNVRSLRRTWLK